MASSAYQERLARDIALVNRVQDGYAPAEPTEDNPRPRIIDGTLEPDAQEALGELYLHYERLAWKQANYYSRKVHNGTSLSAEDLAMQAYFGVYHAAVTFNPTQRQSFTTHAKQYIDHHIRRYISQHDSLVHLPLDARDDVLRYGRTVWSVYQSSERFPVRTRVAAAMGMSEKDVEEIAINEAITMQMGSIDAGYYTDGRDRHTTYDVGQEKWQSIHPEATAMRAVDTETTAKLLQETVRKVLRELASDEATEVGAQVLSLRYFGTAENGWERLSLDDVAKALRESTGHEYSRERIRQIESRTLAILRHPFHSQLARELIAVL